jgi:hypothetical protein
MPLPVPTLDDRSFDELVREARALIPRYSNVWSNHNVSDPGMTLVELFAHLTESAIFQLDQLPPETLDVFLELVGICRGEDEDVQAAVARALDRLDESQVALTATDVAVRAKLLSAQWTQRVHRAGLTWIVDEACSDEDEPDVGLVNVKLDPPAAPYAVEDRLFFLLKEHVTAGTRLHVVQVRETKVEIEATVVRVPGSPLRAEDLERRIREFIDPVRGGFDGTGWPIGRTLYRSELFQLIEAIPDVDHVEALDVSPSDPGSEGVDIAPDELIDPASVVRVEVR